MDIKEAIEDLEKVYNRYWSICSILMAKSPLDDKEWQKYYKYCDILHSTIKKLKRDFKEEL